MPDIETLKNCWKRDGGAPEDVLLSDLEDDAARLNELGSRDPELACGLLVLRNGIVNRFDFGVQLQLFEAAGALPGAEGARELLRGAIVARLEADEDPEACDAAVDFLEDKEFLGRDEFERLPAVKRRGTQRNLKKIMAISIIAAAVLAVVCVLLILKK